MAQMHSKPYSRREFLHMMSVAGAAWAVSACTAPVAPAGGSQADAPAGAAVQLNFWHNNNPAYEQVNTKLVDEFHAMHPTIEIKRVVVPGSELNTKLLPAFASGTSPELLEVPQGTSRFYIQTNHILPVTPTVISATELEELYYAPTIAGLGHQGEYYGIPNNYNLTGAGVLYNRAHWEEAGIQPPDPAGTMPFDELLDAAQALTQRDASGAIVREGFAPQAVAADLYTSLIWQYGGQVVDENNTAIFNSEEGRAALQWFITLYQDAQVATTDLGTNTVTLFYEGQASTQWQGPWASGVLNTQYPDLEYGFFASPNLAGQDLPPYFDHIGGWGNLATETAAAGSDTQDAAFAYLQYRASTENHREFNITTGEMPSLRELVTDPEFQNSPVYSAYIPNLEHGIYFPVRNIALFREIVNGMLEQALLGGASVDEAVAEGEDKMNAMFQEFDAQVEADR